jgi:hypothetical protein
MKHHFNKTNAILIIIFAGWFIGIPIYSGYSLLNEADFLAALPQFENPDLDSFSSIMKKQSFPIIPTLIPIFLPIGRLAFHSFPQTFSLERINPILRC